MELTLADQSRAKRKRAGCATIAFDLCSELEVLVNEIYMRERMRRAKCHGVTGNSALERKQTPWPMRSGHEGWDGTAQHHGGGSVSHCLRLVPSVSCTLINSAVVVTAVIDSNHNMICDLFSLFEFFFCFSGILPNTQNMCFLSHIGVLALPIGRFFLLLFFT